MLQKTDSYKKAVSYIESIISDPEHKRQGNLRLQRIEHLLNLIQNPQNSFKSIHIGGTSGKGGTAYITAALLKKAGYKVGLFISPHLQKINERIQFNGKSISDEDFIYLTQWFKPFINQVAKQGSFGKPTYFETLTAMAFEYFKRKNADFAVIEVGLGGALDATNVINPLVSVITNVDLDHTEILGNTLEKIANEKAGIIKQGINVITAAKQKRVLQIIKNNCRKKRAYLSIIGKDVKFEIKKSDLSGLVFNLETPIANYQLLNTNLLGRHQAENIACAVNVLEKLKDKSTDKEFEINKQIIREALKKIFIPGRIEIIKLNKKFPQIILDGAHNPAKIKTLAKALKELFPNKKIKFIFAAKHNKDVRKMLFKLIPIAKKFYLTKFFSITDFGKKQSMEPKKIASFIKNKMPYEIIFNAKKTLLKALSETEKDDVLCITGSLYLVGECRGLFA